MSDISIEIKYKNFSFFRHDNDQGEPLYYEFSEDLVEYYGTEFGNNEIRDAFEEYVEETGKYIDDIEFDAEADTFAFRSMKEENVEQMIDFLTSEEFKEKVKKYLQSDDDNDE